MGKVLVPPGTGPTGLGIKMRRNGKLRAITPCCERSLRGEDEALCNGCGMDYSVFSPAGRPKITGDIEINNSYLTYWACRVTGLTDLKVEVST